MYKLDIKKPSVVNTRRVVDELYMFIISSYLILQYYHSSIHKMDTRVTAQNIPVRVVQVIDMIDKFSF